MINFLRSRVLNNINTSSVVSFLHANELFCTSFFGNTILGHHFVMSFLYLPTLVGVDT